jgi:hypothetical protein
MPERLPVGTCGAPLTLLARDSLKTFQELADEAFADLLKKHGRPTDLKYALKESLREGEKSGGGRPVKTTLIFAAPVKMATAPATKPKTARMVKNRSLSGLLRKRTRIQGPSSHSQNATMSPT